VTVCEWPHALWAHPRQPIWVTANRREGAISHGLTVVFCWLLVCQAVYREKATLTGLARLAPDIEGFLDQDTGRPNTSHEMIERIRQRFPSVC
jgi:hypothetical protein